ncbi:hypothetical protein GQ44DRAFT_780108 [Phaeosphaeriaceae sp. PMI808]|nr:hypothetical protein GQ44DRAFT_780108 [Phaeosphaeriaceae sp. PMI808]
MGDQAQAAFQEAFRSGVARAYNLSTESDIINNPELFYSNFQQNVSIWNPNIPIDATSSFPGASRVIWDFPLKNELRTDLSQICVSSPFDSFGRAISCLTMPFISLGLSNAPSSDLNLAAKYGIYKDGVTEVSNMTSTFASYLADRPTCGLQTLIRNNATLDLQGAAECLRANCVNASSLLKISPDIIGIGVWTAYFIQVGICFVAPIAAALFRQTTKKRAPPSSAGQRSSENGETSPAQVGLEQKPSENRVKNLVAAFITSLVDFQKAQCYYMMAIQIASKTTLHRNRAEGTVAQREATITVVLVVATLGVVAPTLILYCLCILENRSWYILLLTVTTSALSFNVFFDPDISRIQDRFFTNPDNENARHNNTDPFSLCSIKLTGRDPPWHGISTTWAFYLYGLVLLFFILDHILNLRLPCAKDRSYLLPYIKVQRSLERFVAHLSKRKTAALVKPCGRTAYKLVRLLIFVGMISTSFYILGQVTSSLYSYYSANMVSHDWSFGQIVSVAVWIPVVVDWLQLSLRGMESGSEYRIPHPFRVKQADPSISRPATTSHSDDTPSENAYGTDLENQDSLGLSRRRIATAEF